MIMNLIRIVTFILLASLGVTAWASVVSISNALDRIARTLERIEEDIRRDDADRKEAEAPEAGKPSLPY